jgi:hypothetical protein
MEEAKEEMLLLSSVSDIGIVKKVLNIKTVNHIAWQLLSFRIAPHQNGFYLFPSFDVGRSMFDVRRSSLNKRSFISGFSVISA